MGGRDEHARQEISFHITAIMEIRNHQSFQASFPGHPVYAAYNQNQVEQIKRKTVCSVLISFHSERDKWSGKRSSGEVRTFSKPVHLRRDITSKSPIKSGFWIGLVSDCSCWFFPHTKKPRRPQMLQSSVLAPTAPFSRGVGGFPKGQGVKFCRI